MKKKNKHIIRISALATLTLAIGSGYFLALNNKNVKKAEGYSASSLPTTIDLNDTSAANIRSYYSSLNNLSQSERQGTNLLKNLKTILKNGQKYYSYENGTSIWQMYEITDRDWDKSPASSTTYGTYNSSTNKITNYTYGTSSSSSKNNPYIHALYINRNVNNQTTAWDDHQQTQWGINREHVWPKAEGFDSSGAGGARGDPMHLMAGNGYSNNIHSNYYYGYVKTSTEYTDCGSKYSNQSGNLRGTSKTLNTGTVFEPQDCDKGDIARAIFYMVARYNYLSGSDSDSIDTNNPNLTLTQNISDWSSSGYTSSTSKQGKLGVLTDLLAWHHADPVDEYEIHRNNLLYTNFTNNRNPFIDYPEWVDFIWGTATYNGTTYQSYNSTPTGYATPSSDTINGYNSQVGITNISKESASLVKGQSTSIAATSSNSANISWSSSNTSVATVSKATAGSGENISINAVNAGNATITASVTISGTPYTATCEVTVTNSKVLQSISLSGQTTSYSVGDTFSFTGTCTANYSDGSYGTVTPTSVSSPDMSSAGNKTVTVSYTEGGVTENAQYTITVSSSSGGESETASVSISSYASSNNWENGVKYTSVQLDSVATASVGTGGNNTGRYYTNGNDWRFYQSESASIVVSVASGYELDSVTFTYNSSSSGVLKDSSSNSVTSGSEKSISGSSVTFTVGNSGSATNGQVKFTAISVTYHATAAPARTLSSIVLDTSNVETSFTVGEEFNYDDLGVTAYYSDETSDIVTPTSVSSPDMSTTGNKTVTVSYTEGGVTKTAEYSITVNAKVPTSITATVSKTYYVGETISSSDITVVDNYNDEVSGFTFANNGYQFTYADAASGGTLTDKTFTNSITYSNLTCSLTVQVQRKAYSAPTTQSTTYNATGFSTLKNTYTEGQTITVSGMSFTVDGYYYKSGSKLSISNGSSSAPGKVVNNTAYSTGITNVTVSGASPDIQLSVTGEEGTWVDLSSADTSGTNYHYFKLFYKITSRSGYVNISSFTVTRKGSETPANMANYIMYEDTTNQCNSKFEIAKMHFENLTSSGRSTFMTSSDYVIATARERLEAWARNQGQSITQVNGDYVISSNKSIRLFNGDNTYIIALAISMIGLVGFSGYFFFRFRKREE